jgi:hypothetical protein
MKDGKFTLFRTLFDQDVSVKVIKNNKRGLGSINKCTEEDVKKAIDDALVSAEAGDEDENFDIAPGMEHQEFKMGVLVPDIDKFMERTEELSKIIAREHKKIKVLEICAKYVKSHSVFMNTEGTRDECEAGFYSIMVEFAGFDGDRQHSLDGTQTAVQSQLTHNDIVLHLVGFYHPEGPQHPDGDGEVVSGALFFQICGSKVHNDTHAGYVEAALLEGRRDALGALLYGVIRQTHHEEAYAIAGSHLHGDGQRVHAKNGATVSLD